jgi:DNA-binding transcriptional LysR family regulator
LSISIGNSWDVQRDLLDYKTDISILAHIDPDERLITPLASRGSIRLRELEGEPMIVREHGSMTRRAFEAATEAQDVTPRIVVEIGSREAIREAVLRGIGIGYVSAAEFISDPNLRTVMVEDAKIHTYAHISYLGDRKDSRILRVFLDLVQ